MGMKMSDFEEKKAAEVGNIFNFGTGKCEQMGLYFNDRDGAKKPVYLSSYGIGITRLMGVLAEVFNDKNGIIWPESVAPFQIHLISLCKDAKDVKQADEIYEALTKSGKEVLYDDRADATAGAKFADSDLIGIPVRYIVSAKTLEKKSVEIKKRNEKESKLLETKSLKID